MKIRLLVIFGFLFTASNVLSSEAGHLGVTTDLTFSSKYMMDGFKVGGDHPVVQPSLSIDILTPGFSLMFWSALQLDRANHFNDELDVMARYSRIIFRGSPLAIQVQGFADYWIYPKPELQVDEFGIEKPLEIKQGNKLHLGLSLPALLPIAGSHVIPAYNVYYSIYWERNRKDQYQGGALHQAHLRYAHEVPTLLPGTLAQYLGISGSLNYHDGVFNIRPGLTHSTLQIGTSIYISRFTISLSLDRQWSYRSDLNAGNELWSSLSLTTKI